MADHKAKAAVTGPVPVAIVTVSDSRTPETDVNGQYLRAAITAVGHVVVDYRLIRDEPEEVTAVLNQLSSGPALSLIHISEPTRPY